jgi:uncharacterized membrane protein
MLAELGERAVGDSDGTSVKADQSLSMRQVIKFFLERLQRELSEFERDANSSLTGTQRRANELSRRFALARSQTPAASPLFSLPVLEFARLLDSNNEEDRRTLVEGLATWGAEQFENDSSPP